PHQFSTYRERPQRCEVCGHAQPGYTKPYCGNYALAGWAVRAARPPRTHPRCETQWSRGSSACADALVSALRVQASACRGSRLLRRLCLLSQYAVCLPPMLNCCEDGRRMRHSDEEEHDLPGNLCRIFHCPNGGGGDPRRAGVAPSCASRHLVG